MKIFLKTNQNVFVNNRFGSKLEGRAIFKCFKMLSEDRTFFHLKKFNHGISLVTHCRSACRRLPSLGQKSKSKNVAVLNKLTLN